MRSVTKMLVVGLLVGALAVPVVAWSQGWGRGGHMMGPQGSAAGYCYGPERGYGDVTNEQRSKLEELDKKFYSETANLRNEISTKSAELNSLLRSPDPDPEKARVLQGELSALRAKVDEKSLAYELEARKILPGLRSSGMYGMGYGNHMGGYGPHMGYGC